MKRPMLASIAAGTVFLIALGGYLWWYQQVALLSTSAEMLTTQISTRSRAELHIIAARTAISDLAGEEESVGSYFVAQANIVPFIEQLQSLGSTAGATVNVLSVAADTVAQNPPITITLSIAGTFDHVVRAVGAIEYAPYDITVSSLALAGTKGAWQANMTIVVGSTGAAPVTAGAAIPVLPVPPTITASTSVATTSAKSATSSAAQSL